jgi:predicted nucleotidyltransferase
MNKVATFLFGSGARGDCDEASDVDVLAIYPSAIDGVARAKTRSLVEQHLGGRVALAEYSQARIEEMFREGHLFCWHLFLEARPLNLDTSGSLANYAFRLPSPYLGGKEDSQRFLTLLKSIFRELSQGKHGSEVHEAGLIYLALRNISMSLSYTSCVRPDFTRNSPFHLSTTLGIAPPCDGDFYDLLIRCRHSSQRGMKAPTISDVDLMSVAERSVTWANEVIRRVYGSE